MVEKLELDFLVGVRNDKILRIPFVPFSFTKISSMRSSLLTGYME